MPAGVWNTTIEQGSTFIKTVTITDSNGTAVDLTGCTVRWQVRERKGSTSTLIDVSTTEGSITLTDPTNGQCKITLSDTVTAALDFEYGYHDFEVETAAGVTTRYMRGIVTLSKEVTR